MTRSPALMAWAVIVAVSTFVVLDFRAPAPSPVGAPTEAFSAGRAWDHLVTITRAPHPAGSFEYATVREHITTTLSDLGFDVQIQVATVDERPTLSNVLGRLEGTCDRNDAVLLATHYDSVSSGPGAGDAGTAVAAILETARAITAGEALCNDVITLITGAEESSLAGSEAFVERHEWARDVGVVLNFDARGGTGPLILGEWAQASPELVRVVAGEVPRFFSNSILNEAPQRVHQHGTDFEHLRRLGVAGVNAAHVGDSIYYHTPGDTPAVVSRATLQHNGEVALALARYFGDADLDHLPHEADGVWVSLSSQWLLVYGTSVAWLLGVVVLALLVAMVWAARRQGARWGSLACGVLAVVVAALTGVVVVSVLLTLVRVLHPGADEYLRGFLPHYEDLPDAWAYWWGFVTAAAAVSALVLGLARRWLTALELAVSATGLIATLGVLATAFAQPVSFFFVIPALGSLVGTLVWIVRCRTTLERLGATLLVTLGAVPALLVYVGFLRFSAAARLGLSALLMPIVALLVALLVPQLETLRRLHRWFAPSVLGMLAIALFSVGAITIDVDPSTTRVGRVDTLAAVDTFDPVLFDRVGNSPWTVGIVATEDGRRCLQASVRNDVETGDVGMCPIAGALRPRLDFQWGRTATGRPTDAPGARAAGESAGTAARPEEDSAAILFGAVNGEAAVVRVIADGVAYDAQPRLDPELAAWVWVVALPAGSNAVDEIVLLEGSGQTTDAAPGFRLRPRSTSNP